MKRRIFPLFAVIIFLSQHLSAQQDTLIAAAVKGMTIHSGGITVYEKPGTYYMELPASIFDKDILWFAEIKSGPLVTGALANMASSGQVLNSIMVRLEKNGEKVFVRENSTPLALRMPDVPMSPADKERMERSLSKINTPAILLSLPVVATGIDGTVLVNATPLLTQNLPFFDVKRPFPGLVMQDPSRSYVGEIKSFSNNLRFYTNLTFDVSSSGGAFMDMLAKIKSSVATITVAHTLSILPENKMKPRLADPRIGYFDNGFTELKYGSGYSTKAYISKYRLEKKNPNAKLSEPVNPIVYYIGPDVPSRWRSVFKEAVEYWNKPFEAIGFKNAIVAKDPPNDPTWSPDDLGHSVIRWVNQPIANAMGPHNVDPRTGEILSAHVMIWEDVFSMATQWYYLQAGGSDKRASKLPLPDDIANALMKYIVAHEVGHSIGLRHNHRASQIYTTEQLRDKKFTDANGSVGSIMSYGRMNYIAQPGDGVTNMIPQFGPYDFHVIKYGYEPINNASTPEDEIPTLNKWLEVQRTDNRLLWSAEDKAAKMDPTVLTENIGSDRIDAARLGLMNLQRAVDNLPHAIGQSPQDINKLKSYYTAAIGERSNWLQSAVKELYGFKEYRYLAPKQTEFVPEPVARKKEVVKYLLSELKNVSPLFTPTMRNLFPPDELAKMITESQTSLFTEMTSDQVLNNMHINAINGKDDYTPLSYLEEVTNGIFEEVKGNPSAINPVRMDLQYMMTARLISLSELKTDNPIAGFAQPAARKVLLSLLSNLKPLATQTGESESKVHLANLINLISKSLGVPAG